MCRIILFFCLAGLTGMAVGLWGSGTMPALPEVVAGGEHGGKTPAALPEEASRDLPADLCWQQTVLASISRLRMDSDKKDFDAVMAMLSGQDRSIVEGILGQIPDGEVCGYLLNRLAIGWAQQKPAETATWLLGLPENIERNEALISVGRTWAETDPAAASAYAVQLPPGKLREQALNATLGAWVHQDIVAAANWMNQYGAAPEFNAAAAEIARSPAVAGGDFVAGVKWAESITDPEQRLQTIAQVLAGWAQKNPAAVMEYAKNTTALSSDQRGELLDDLQINP